MSQKTLAQDVLSNFNSVKKHAFSYQWNLKNYQQRWTFMYQNCDHICVFSLPKVSLLWHSGGASMVKCYAGSSIATGGASHARQIKGYDPDKNRYPGPPGWGWVWGWPHPINFLRSFQNWKPTETTKMAQHKQGFTSRNVEGAVSA